MKKTWYELFSENINAIFTKKDFEGYKNMILKDLKYYKKYISKGAKILDLGCGLGCTAVPLSTLGYKVIGIDNDPAIVKAVRKNAENFGKNMEIVQGDILQLDQYFKKDSFDACISGGVLEHFKKQQIRKLVELQLDIAPMVIASMPVKTKRTRDHYGFTEKTALDHISENGIYRNFWSEDEWVNDVLKEFKIVEHSVGKADILIGGSFDEIFIVIKRNKK